MLFGPHSTSPRPSWLSWSVAEPYIPHRVNTRTHLSGVGYLRDLHDDFGAPQEPMLEITSFGLAPSIWFDSVTPRNDCSFSRLIAFTNSPGESA